MINWLKSIHFNTKSTRHAATRRTHRSWTHLCTGFLRNPFRNLDRYHFLGRMAHVPCSEILAWILLLSCRAWTSLSNFHSDIRSFWVFIYTKNLSRAFQTFFRSQQIQTDDCGEQSGLFWGISSACSIIPCLGILAAIISLVFMILYLVKVTECKNRVESLALEPQPQRKPITQYPNDQNDNPYAPH